jgi:hypothetical protein
MSYDIWLEADLGGTEPVRTDALDHWNYTSNVAPMWRKAMPESNGLAGLEGMTCADAAVHLARGIGRMEADPDEYRKLNPENGWGDFDSQLESLRKLLTACRMAPRAKVAIWR